MEYGYSILMAVFSAALLLYAGLMALTKDFKMLPFRARTSVKPKNSKKYMTQLAKVVALVACSPALSAVVGLWNMIAALIVLIVTGVLFIWLGTKLMKNEDEIDRKGTPSESGKTISVTFVNEVEEADIWILPQTEENLQTSLWGIATIPKLKSGVQKTVGINGNQEKYIVRIIDVDQAYYSANDIALDENYMIRFRTDESKFEAKLVTSDPEGNSVTSENILQGVFGAK